MNTKISIIIPVYNVAKYLSKCLDSVINQTYKNIEIICVNDGSTDDSLKILELYKNKDSRIIIINKENGGLSSARNAGLKIATGELCYFLDSDDYIDIHLFEDAIDKFKKFNIDYYCFGSQIINYEKKHSKIFSLRFSVDKKYLLINFLFIKIKIKINKSLIDAKEIQQYIDIKYDGLHHSSCEKMLNTNIHVWNKIFKTKFINEKNIEFIEGRLYEDIYFMLTYNFYSNLVYFEPKKYHYYRIHANSIMSKTSKNLSINNSIDHMINFHEVLKKISYNSKIFCDNINYLYSLLEMYSNRTKEMSNKQEQVLVDIIKERYLNEIKYNYQNLITNGNKEENCTTLDKETSNCNTFVIDTFKCTNCNNNTIIDLLLKINDFYFIPNKGNLGDMAIATACYQIFDSLNLNYQIIDMSEYEKYINLSTKLVYGGGGLFTKYYQQYYQNILKIFKSKQLEQAIILPASFYDCDDVLECFDERFTVFCREKQSYEYCISKNKKANFLLADDIVFSLNTNFIDEKCFNKNAIEKNIENINEEQAYNLYKYYTDVIGKFNRTLKNSSNVGYFFREDKESIKNVIKDVYSLIDLSLTANSYCFDKSFTKIMIKNFFKMIDSYEYIVTDRLHIGICSALRGKKIRLVDNSYKKLSNVFEKSMTKYNNVKFYDNINDLLDELNKENNNIFEQNKNNIPILSYQDFKLQWLSEEKFNAEKIYWKEIL